MRKIDIKEEGITLVALAITIIIILILAGVTLNTALGDNGLFQMAKKSTEEYQKSEIEEDEALKSVEEEIDRTLRENETVTRANAPKLTTGMIPIKYVSNNEGEGESSNNGSWVICRENDPDWYSYTEEERKWANVMLSDCGSKENGEKYTKGDIGAKISEGDLGSMFVWIPRYAYNIEEGYHTNTSNPKIEIQWLEGKSNRYVDEEKNVHEVKTHKDSEAEETKPEKQFIVHPAFTNGEENGYADGEWKAEIEGIWVSKFEAGIGTSINVDKVSSNTVSSNNVTKIEYPKVDIQYNSNGVKTPTNYYLPMFKGRQFAYNYVIESQCYNLSLALDDDNNPYGLNSNANSHLIKNSEWGAVAYLAISKYGANEPNTDNICKNDVIIVALSNIASSPIKNPNNTAWAITAVTGYSSNNKIHAGTENVIKYTAGTILEDNCNNSYAWNVVERGKNEGKGTKASTTGNITGIYDMEGCLGCYTTAWVNYGTKWAYGEAFTNEGKSTYLATAYPPNETAARKDFDSSYSNFKNICGDAVYEISSSCGEANSWFKETLENDTTANEPFILRGGVFYDSTTAGLCGLYDSSGLANYNHGFFSTLIVE